MKIRQRYSETTKGSVYKMLTDEELAAVPEELLKDLLRYSEYG